MLVAYVDATFVETDEELRTEFVTMIDESPYSAREWIDGLKLIGEWLDGRGLKMALRDRIGYLCCAASSAGPTAGMDHLPSLVFHMLDTHGCERALRVN